ncbi:hypothetical protein J6590_056449 [Homalodisca vitripennis]|nr:hypothetical protein J6590_056449 [Homalodisca vitripennis]
MNGYKFIELNFKVIPVELKFSNTSTVAERSRVNTLDITLAPPYTQRLPAIHQCQEVAPTVMQAFYTSLIDYLSVPIILFPYTEFLLPNWLL